MPGEIDPLAVQFAKLEGVIVTELKNLSHDVRNINQTLGGMVTRVELQAAKEAHRDVHAGVEARIVAVETGLDTRIEALAERAEKQESNWSKLAWAVGGSWLAGLGVVTKVAGWWGGH